MANPLKIAVENPEELLNVGLFDTGAVIEIQWSATETGSYAAISGTGSTPTISLVTGTRAYTGYDPNGTFTTWYRVRYRNAGSTRFSVDWAGDALWATRPGHAPFQVGAEEGGLICSIYDVKQMLGRDATVTSDDEELLDLIRAVTVDFESETGRQFTGAQTDVTWQTHTQAGRVLSIPIGIQSVTTLAIATIDQPATGGTYATVASSAYYLDPPLYERDPYWPATRIVMSRYGGGFFYDAAYGAQITGRPGWAQVPPNIARIAAGAVIAKFLTKGSQGPRAVIGPDGRTTILRDVSPGDYAKLMRYAVIQGA